MRLIATFFEFPILMTILIIGLIICIILLLREIRCWYWKINDRIDKLNEIVKNQKEEIEVLKEINEKLGKSKSDS